MPCKFSKDPTLHHGSMLTEGQESVSVARQVILIFKVSNLAKENNHFSRKRALVLMLWNPPVTFDAFGAIDCWNDFLNGFWNFFYEQLIVQRIQLVLHTVLTLYFVFFFPFFFRFELAEISKNSTPQTLLLVEWQNFQTISPK